MNKQAELTDTQREILALIATGQNNREIMDATGLAYSTVRNAASAVYRVLNVHNRANAVVAAREWMGKDGKE